MIGVKVFVCAMIIASALLPNAASAVGIEASVGVWNQDPRGEMSFQEITAVDRLNLENDLRYGNKVRLLGRIKIETPLILPNIYLMATPMSFDATGIKSTQFNFGNATIAANVPFNSRLKLDHYDVGFYYGLPFLKTATAKVLNVDLGLLARFVDLEAEVSQLQAGIQESEKLIIPIPMLYAGVQLKPVGWFVAEGELRGVLYAKNHYYDLIARAKFKPLGPVFIAGGYRYEKVKIDQSDFKAEANFGGPFGEVGIDF